MTSRTWPLPTIALIALLAACTKDNTDAWGNFEAVETHISAESAGRLLLLDAAEGSTITAGALVAQVDTSAIAVQRGELLAHQASVRAHLGEIAANSVSVEGQLAIARREFDRMTRLKAAEAATAEQVDKAERDVTVLAQQLQALQANRDVVNEEVKTVDAQLFELKDKLGRGKVFAPLTGTVLTRFVEPGEMVQAGTPLISVASLDTLVFRAYLGGDQLNQVHVGSNVWVRVDAGNGKLQTHPGQVTWIATAAEFTPTPIQTRKERTTQVYAVKIVVANPDRALRIGMPGELRFTADTVAK